MPHNNITLEEKINEVKVAITEAEQGIEKLRLKYIHLQKEANKEENREEFNKVKEVEKKISLLNQRIQKLQESEVDEFSEFDNTEELEKTKEELKSTEKKLEKLKDDFSKKIGGNPNIVSSNMVTLINQIENYKTTLSKLEETKTTVDSLLDPTIDFLSDTSRDTDLDKVLGQDHTNNTNQEIALYEVTGSKGGLAKLGEKIYDTFAGKHGIRNTLIAGTLIAAITTLCILFPVIPIVGSAGAVVLSALSTPIGSMNIIGLIGITAGTTGLLAGIARTIPREGKSYSQIKDVGYKIAPKQKFKFTLKTPYNKNTVTYNQLIEETIKPNYFQSDEDKRHGIFTFETGDGASIKFKIAADGAIKLEQDTIKSLDVSKSRVITPRMFRLFYKKYKIAKNEGNSTKANNEELDAFNSRLKGIVNSVRNNPEISDTKADINNLITQIEARPILSRSKIAMLKSMIEFINPIFNMRHGQSLKLDTSTNRATIKRNSGVPAESKQETSLRRRQAFLRNL